VIGEGIADDDAVAPTMSTEARLLEAAAPVPELEVAAATSAGTAIGMTFAANAMTLVIGVGTGVLAARLLGPVGEGQLAAIQTWPILLGSLAMLGLPEALVYFISREPARGRQLSSTAVLMGLVASVTVGGIAWVVMPMLLSSQDHAVIDAARVFLLIGVIFAFVGIPHGSLRGARQFRAWNVLRIAPGLAWLAILCVAWAMGRASAVPLSRWFLVGVAAVGLPVLVVAGRRLRGTVRPSFGDAGPLLRFGLPSVLTTVPQTINLRLDQLMIVALLPARYLGLYVVAVAWSGAITPALSAIGSVLFPHISAEPDQDRKTRALVTALQGATVIGVVVTVVLLAVAPFGIPFVYGSRFEGAVVPALVLVPAGGVLAWAGVAEEGLRGFGRPGLVLVAEGVGAVMTVATLPVLLHFLGILGAALASLLGYLTVAVACAVALGRSTGAPRHAFVVPTARSVATLSREGRAAVGRLTGRSARST
jgi:O-antigen/teichoic acid export membrane protein